MSRRRREGRKRTGEMRERKSEGEGEEKAKKRKRRSKARGMAKIGAQRNLRTRKVRRAVEGEESEEKNEGCRRP